MGPTRPWTLQQHLDAQASRLNADHAEVLDTYEEALKYLARRLMFYNGESDRTTGILAYCPRKKSDQLCRNDRKVSCTYCITRDAWNKAVDKTNH